MNPLLMRRLVACFSLVALGMVCSVSGAENTSAPQDATGQEEQPATEAQTAPTSAAAQGEGQPTPEAATPAANQPAENAAAEQGAVPSTPTEGAAAEPEKAAEVDAGEEPEKAATPEEKPEPITGAFGLRLGERFDPCMVATVISEEEKGYAAGEHAEFMGTRYRVEPKVPNKLFTTYYVDTTKDGLIYAIRADYVAQERLSTCDVTKKLATFLKEKYGEPRAQGSFGEWYSFRDLSNTAYKGVRLYAQRCRRGPYTILYTDDAVRMSPPPPPPEITEQSGL